MKKGDILRAAWDLELPTPEKIVLLCLVQHYNPDTGQCNPSYDRLAKMTGLCRRTISKAFRGLRDKGLIGTVKTKLTLQCSLSFYVHEVHGKHARDAQHEAEMPSRDQLDMHEWNRRLREIEDAEKLEGID
jgi:DNA-binding transcriptional regulator YhcF (GntR family)